MRHYTRSRCQAILKYPQCVEKAVKAVLDKLCSVGLLAHGSDRGHKVARYVSALTLFPTTDDSKYLLKQMRRLFTQSVVEQIDLLDSLVPAYPAKRTLAQRNHEYPYQLEAGDWNAPSSEDAFTAGELKRIRKCATMLVRRPRLIFDALELVYP